MAMTSTPAPAISPAEARFGTRALLAALALTLVAVPFALLLFLVEDRWRPLLLIDNGARDDLHAYALQHHWLVTVAKALSTIGSTPVYLVVFAAVAGWLAHRGLRRLALFVVVTMVGSALLNLLVKTAVHRARPVLPDPVARAHGLSFPSGHAQGIVVACGVLLLVFLPALRGPWRRVAVGVAVVMVSAIGAARVALGVHYVSDVLAGYVLGAAWVAAMTAAFSAWRRDRGRRDVDPARGLEPEQAQRLRPGSVPGPPAGGGS
jgi:membrane-associated phospholipid phosphatase